MMCGSPGFLGCLGSGRLACHACFPSGKGFPWRWQPTLSLLSPPTGPGAAGQNKQHSITKNTAKLDRETEELHHDRVPLEVGKVIQQGQQSKRLMQKELVMKINEKLQVIVNCKGGLTISINQALGKIESHWPQAPGEGQWEAD